MFDKSTADERPQEIDVLVAAITAFCRTLIKAGKNTDPLEGAYQSVGGVLQIVDALQSGGAVSPKDARHLRSLLDALDKALDGDGLPHWLDPQIPKALPKVPYDDWICRAYAAATITLLMRAGYSDHKLELKRATLKVARALGLNDSQKVEHWREDLLGDGGEQGAKELYDKILHDHDADAARAADALLRLLAELYGNRSICSGINK